MARVVPSQVVALIDQMFSFAATQQERQWEYVGPNRSSELSAVVALIEQIPSELVFLDVAEFGVYICALAAMRDILHIWYGGPEEVWVLTELEGVSTLNPI